jgi:hypothetical protein
LKYNVHPIWVSRDNPFLQKADCPLKGIDSDNWSVGAEDFSNLDVRFGPFTIDLFATCENKKTERFYSRSFERGNTGTDAFAHKWDGECAYLAPPVTFVMRAIRKAAVSKMRGVNIVPLWKGAKFWTYGYRERVHLNGLFAEMHVIRMRAQAWEISRKDMVGGKELQFQVLVLATARDSSVLELVTGKRKCFRKLFGKICDDC